MLGGGGTGTTPQQLASAGSTPTARSTTSFNPGANDSSSTPWRCRRTGRSWSAATSPRWRAGDRLNVRITSGGSADGSLDELQSGRECSGLALACRRTGRSWSVAFTTLGGGGPARRRAQIGRLTNTGAAIQEPQRHRWRRRRDLVAQRRRAGSLARDVRIVGRRRRRTRRSGAARACGRLAVERPEPAGQPEPVHSRAGLLRDGSFTTDPARSSNRLR